MPDVRGRFGVFAAAVGFVAAAVIGLPCGTASADDPSPNPGERIPAYDVALTIGVDGVLNIRETITYDFNLGGEHGIVRRVPYRENNRLYEIRDVRTSSSTGAPARAETDKRLHDVRISVGNERRTVTGRQAYVIEYKVAGAFTPLQGRDEVSWDAIGTDWNVPIGEAAIRVEGPVPLRRIGCLAGRAPATTRCLRDRDGPYAMDFTQRGLRPHEGMVVKVVLPKGAVDVAVPRYAPPHWAGTWTGTLLLVCALGAVVLTGVRRPRGYPGDVLIASGATLILADALDNIVADDVWAFSLGDLCLAGLALAITGAALRVSNLGTH
ncbi:DUF2207 domain-containing protein [Spirillospora sp. CA-294931]|uniref:DUF2207 domain-containing protein n=1 Tax=Spirillospora sp. CA-294931 TaxID=3240042 RepID=UPI003D941029